MADPLESLVSQKSSDSGLHIQLHPLILLTISDHITRHVARQKKGPIIGVLLGQQNGRIITLEQAFECLVRDDPNGELHIPTDWFTDRVQMYKDVHNHPPLDVVGWWSTAPPSGPNAVHLPIQRQILQDYNESAVFLAFHPSQLRDSSMGAGKLPLTVYESVYEGDHTADGGKRMQVDGEEQSLTIRFRQLPYSVETGEAEMIGIDTISRTGRNAAVEPRSVPSSQQKGGEENGISKDKEKGQDDEPVVLSHDQEELIASLHTRLNAIRTLESRITLIKSYLSSLTEDDSKPNHLSHPILRNINSLLSHLSLLTPHEQSALSAETRLQHEDVLLVSMLGQLNQSIRSMRDLAKKAAILQNARQGAMSRKAFAMQSLFEEEYLRDSPGSSEMFS